MMIRMTLKIAMKVSVTNCVYGVTIMMMINNDDVSLVCSPAHTVWCDSVGFNDKLLLVEDFLVDYDSDVSK